MPKPPPDQQLIIVIGHAAQDHVFRIEKFPPRPTKVRAIEHLECGGGSAANAAVAIARLGGRVAFWSRVGADETGRRIVSGLAEEGVDCRHIYVHEGSRSSEAAVIVDSSGERLIVSERDHAMPGDPGWLPLDQVAKAAVVLSDLRWFEGTLAVFREARRHGVATVLDIDIGGLDGIGPFLELSDYAIFSALALERFDPAADVEARLRQLLRFGVKHAGVTRGADGYCWIGSDGIRSHPSFRVAAVDTTGAGDAFHGAFAWALAHGHDEATAARFSCAVAALKCRKLGARAGLPTRAEVDSFLQTANAEAASICPSPLQRPRDPG